MNVIYAISTFFNQDKIKSNSTRVNTKLKRKFIYDYWKTTQDNQITSYIENL